MKRSTAAAIVLSILAALACAACHESDPCPPVPRAGLLLCDATDIRNTLRHGELVVGLTSGAEGTIRLVHVDQRGNAQAYLSPWNGTDWRLDELAQGQMFGGTCLVVAFLPDP